jgi:hypothetical protein
MGRTLIGPHPQWNKRGHFEDRDMHRLNRLLAYRFAYNDAIHNETLHRYPTLRDYNRLSRDKLLSLYRRELGRMAQGELWGLKCIMLATIWPDVQHLFPQDRRLIVVCRDMQAVIASRMAHSDLTRDEAETVSRYLMRAAVESAGIGVPCPVLYVEYEKLCAEPEAETRGILEFVTEDTDVTLNVEAAIKSIEPRMNHASMFTVDVLK